MEKLNGKKFYLHDDPFYESYVPELGYDHETDPYNLEYTLIGEFTVSENINEKQTGSFNAPEKFKVYVYENEGKRVPHCHVVDGKKDVACIKLENAEYFIHGKHTGKLTNKQAEAFYEFMKAIHPSHYRGNRSNIVNWEFAMMDWDGNDNTKYSCKPILHIPRYDLLNKPRYYQYTINGVELFRYLKQYLHPGQWKDLITDKSMKEIFNTNIFHKYSVQSFQYFFKFEGYEMFKESILEDVRRLLLPQIRNNLKLVEKRDLMSAEVYSDAYQIIFR